jgi:L-alanine-DL-glutamate epimerase-like enolase superfamily enzyme
MAVLAGPVTIAKVEIRVFRAPIAVPVRTSFGTMHDRPAVIVRVEDGQGNHGWGEVWCNFPSCGAEHRARLVETAVVPHVLGKTFADPAEAFDEMTRGVEVLALQADEPGPLAQAVAGVGLRAVGHGRAQGGPPRTPCWARRA